MTIVTADTRYVTRPRRGRLPRGSGPFWTDTPLLVNRPHDSMSPWIVAPAGVPETFTEPGGAILTAGFWTCTDGSWHAPVELIQAGVDPTHTFEVPAGPRPNTLVLAWYFDLSGGGVGQPGSGVSLDELSLDDPPRLLDDPDFVTVTDDPSLTESANQDGWLATDTAHVLTARPTADNGAIFAGWVFCGPGVAVRGDTLIVDAGANAWALATYEPLEYTSPSGTVQVLPGIDPDIAAVLVRLLNEPGSDQITAASRRLAAQKLIRSAAFALNPDAGGEIGKALDADAAQLLRL